MSDETQTLEETRGVHKSSRRALLRLAVPAAAGVAALAAVGATDALRPEVAHAANGDNVVIGTSNAGTGQTGLTITGTGGGIGAFLAVDELTGGGSYGLGATSDLNTGVYAVAGARVSDPDDSIDKTYTGVYGHVSHASGSSAAGTGYGVKAHANRGAAPLLLLSSTGQSANGAPTTSAANGAVNVDSNGVLYSRRFNGWYPLASLHFLPAPMRLLDTRSGQPAADSPGAPIGPNGTFHLPVAGVTYGGSSIPSGAKGVFGNITLGTGSQNGNLVFYPDGGSVPNANSIAFTANTYVSNFTGVGIGGNGKVAIFNQSNGSTNLTFDAFAYII